jgi:hypothetical protein
MDGRDFQPRLDALPHCAVCNEVIGVYERLVHLNDGLARQTSRAAEPIVCRSGGECYHLACYPEPTSP